MTLIAANTQQPSYVNGLVYPLITAVISLMIGAFVTYLLTRTSNREVQAQRTTQEILADQNTTLAAHSEALAVLVGKIVPLETRVDKVESRGSRLSESLAILETELRLHKEWAKEAHDSTQTRISTERRGHG